MINLRQWESSPLAPGLLTLVRCGVLTTLIVSASWILATYAIDVLLN